MDRSGKSLTPLDMLIAAHALSIDAVLVTSDKAFLHVPQMKTVSWV
jgi:tRNA(fMet)-specific endonuclease VapC